MLRLEDFFDALVISSDYGFRKPDPRMFYIALAMLDVQASETAYIGNSYHTDILGAKAAGARQRSDHFCQRRTRAQDEVRR